VSNLINRVFIIIMDGCGVGEMPDAGDYGDTGSNTLANLALHLGGFNLPNLEKLGLGKIVPIKGISQHIKAQAAYGKMAEASAGKDSTTGHWELGGIVIDQPFPTYPNGFPMDVISQFTKETGYGILGNKPASGTEIIQELGEEHVRTGKPIVYTSADSVFQIAAHEDIIPLKELYDICLKSRKLLKGEHAVARVIARPFTGDNAGNYVRTKYRKDFSLQPFSKTMFNILKENSIQTYAIGKIFDLYNGSGIVKNVETKQNSEGMEALLQSVVKEKSGLIMANLVDFDMLWGHRNDSKGFYEGLREFDEWLPRFLDRLEKNDALFLTADHGNDPTMPSTDHSREYVPIIAYGKKIQDNVNLGTRESFADLQATLAELFNVPTTGSGKSFAKEILMS